MRTFRTVMHILYLVILSTFLAKGISAQAAETPLSSDTTIQPATESVVSAAQAFSSGMVEECALIGFEGIGNNARVGTVTGPPGIPRIVFGSSWLGLVDADMGGSGNFANEPSPSTTAYYLDQSDISIRFDAGVQLVEFNYSAAAVSLPVTISAFDEDGNLIDRATGTTIGTNYDGAACSGDPSGMFCLWDKVTLASTSNNIRLISIEGTVSNYFGIDDLKVCIGKCAPPDGEQPADMLIPISESCCWEDSGKCLERRNFAGSIWEDCLISQIIADSGEKIELWCISGSLPCNLAPGIGHYELHYFFPDGGHNKVGVCPFEGGRNSGVLFHSGDLDGNGNPDCFIRTRWTSKDQQAGDKDDDGDGKIDWWVFTYDVANNNFNKVNYDSTDGPGGSDPDTVARTDPPLGPETEAMLDQLIVEFEEIAGEEDVPMGPTSYDPSDLNRDGKTDGVDLSIFESAFESCEGEMLFNSDADFNGDGCVTLEDMILLFPPVIQVPIDIKPGSYPNAVNLGAQGLIPVAILSTEAFDATTVNAKTVELSGAGVDVRGKGNKYLAHAEDVNADGLLDLVVQVATANLAPGSLQDGYAVLTGTTFDGQAIEGSDEVVVVPPEK